MSQEPRDQKPRIRLTHFPTGRAERVNSACPSWRQVLRHLVPIESEQALVDASTSDDAAVYALGDGRALVVTLDFFAPLVDDPYDFGRIAAANALSDIYAMGADPLFVLNLLAFPRALLDHGLARRSFEEDQTSPAKPVCPSWGATRWMTPNPSMD